MLAYTPLDDLQRILLELHRLADEASRLASRLEAPAPTIERARSDRLLLNGPRGHPDAQPLSKTSMYELVLHREPRVS